MFTLDETTLYYWSLYSPDESHKTGVVTDWRSAVTSFDPLKTKGKAASKSVNSRVPSLTHASTRTSSKSVLTEKVMITADRKPDVGQGPAKQSNPVTINEVGGLFDEDEINGEERDVAVSSPIKGKLRLTSTVCGRFSGPFEVD
jgi:hypothetical protein